MDDFRGKIYLGSRKGSILVDVKNRGENKVILVFVRADENGVSVNEVELTVSNIEPVSSTNYPI